MRAITTRDKFHVSVNAAELILIHKPKDFGTIVFTDSAQRALKSLIKKKKESDCAAVVSCVLVPQTTAVQTPVSSSFCVREKSFIV